MTHFTDLKGPSEELFNVLDDLLAYLHIKAEEGTAVPHENHTIRKARQVLQKYAGEVA